MLIHMFNVDVEVESVDVDVMYIHISSVDGHVEYWFECEMLMSKHIEA